MNSSAWVWVFEYGMGEQVSSLFKVSLLLKVYPKQFSHTESLISSHIAHWKTVRKNDKFIWKWDLVRKIYNEVFSHTVYRMGSAGFSICPQICKTYIPWILFPEITPYNNIFNGYNFSLQLWCSQSENRYVGYTKMLKENYWRTLLQINFLRK